MIVITDDHYFNVLRNEVEGLLDDTLLNIKKEVYQLDGAPEHFIDRGGLMFLSINRPARFLYH